MTFTGQGCCRLRSHLFHAKVVRTLADQYLSKMAERLDPRQADLALNVPALTQEHELIRGMRDYVELFTRASGQTTASVQSPPAAGRQAGGETLPRPQASPSVADAPPRQGCAAPGCACP